VDKSTNCRADSALLDRNDPSPRPPFGSFADAIPEDAAGSGQLLGTSAPMLALHRQIERVAATTASVLLAGETGTGKEVVARAIHARSERAKHPFVAINCGAIPAALVESELFGHEQGSFTGANRRHHGVFAQADHGTLFLDEITEMSVDMQVRLLRVLENGVFRRIGGEKPVQSDVRVIAAANRNPETAVREGRLREDLFYRLRVFPITLPALRERGADVVLLAEHFLRRLNQEAGTDKRFTAGACERMQAYGWPGNVRELKHFVQQMFLLADRDLDAAALQAPQMPPAGRDWIEVRVGSSIAAAEQQLITATMERFGGNKARMAKVLGISLKTLYIRLNLYQASTVCG
jgi:DNA-binding NtrC family response regulator